MFPSGVGGDPKQLKRDRNITLNYWWWSSVAAGRLDKELFAQVFQYKKTMISQCCSLTVSIAHRSQENRLFHTWGLWLPFGLWPIRTKQYLLSNKQIILAFFFFLILICLTSFSRSSVHSCCPFGDQLLIKCALPSFGFTNAPFLLLEHLEKHKWKHDVHHPSIHPSIHYLPLIQG